MPVNRWSSIIAQICRETKGLTASTSAIGDRLNRLGLAGLSTANAFNGPQSRVDVRWEHLFGNRPLEHSDDVPGSLVDLPAAEIRVKELLANSLERQGPELLGGGHSVEFLQRLERQPNVRRFVRRVPGVNVCQVGHDDLVDRCVVFRFKPAAVGKPLGDSPVVCGFAGLGPVDT